MLWGAGIKIRDWATELWDCMSLLSHPALHLPAGPQGLSSCISPALSHTCPALLQLGGRTWNTLGALPSSLSLRDFCEQSLCEEYLGIFFSNFHPLPDCSSCFLKEVTPFMETSQGFFQSVFISVSFHFSRFWGPQRCTAKGVGNIDHIIASHTVQEPPTITNPIFSISVVPQFSLSSSSCTSQPVYQPKHWNTLWLWEPKTVKRNLSELLEYSKISWQSHLCKGLDDLKQNWRVMLMKCSDLDPNICLQQILKDSVSLQRNLQKKNLGFDIFLVPPAFSSLLHFA